jgi:hypothetical protein
MARTASWLGIVPFVLASLSSGCDDGDGDGASGGANAGGGSGGMAGAETATGGTAPMTCGSALCPGHKLGGVVNISACCAGQDGTQCGVTIDKALSGLFAVPTGCYETGLPGKQDCGCPSLPLTNPTDGKAVGFNGCCTPSGRCGLDLSLEFFEWEGNPPDDPGLGCHDSEPITGEPASACAPGQETPPVSDQGCCLSSQVLCGTECAALDESENCGGCGLACDKGTMCSASTCKPLTVLATLPSVAELQSNGSDLFWVAWSSPVQSAIMKMPVSGGSATQLTTEANEIEFATDATSLYWTNGVAVKKLPLGGGTAMTLATDSGVRQIALDATDVYWTSEGGTVKKVPLAGGTTVTLASGQNAPSAIAVDSSYVYWATSLTQPPPPGQGIATLMKAPLGGGAPSLVAERANNLGWTIAVDGTHLYFMEVGKNGYTLMKVSVAGGVPETLHKANGGWQERFSLDATDLYWVNDSSGSLVSMPVAGGTPVKLATGVNVFAVDATNVYFYAAGAGPGELVRLPR